MFSRKLCSSSITRIFKATFYSNVIIKIEDKLKLTSFVFSKLGRQTVTTDLLHFLVVIYKQLKKQPHYLNPIWQ